MTIEITKTEQELLMKALLNYQTFCRKQIKSIDSYAGQIQYKKTDQEAEKLFQTIYKNWKS